ALPVRTGSTGSLLAPNRVVAGCPLAGCKSVSWMPPAGQVVTLPAFMAPLGSLQVPAGRTMLTSPGRTATDGRASPAGVGGATAGSLHPPPSQPNGTMLTSPGRSATDGRASPAGVGSATAGSLHLPPSHPNRTMLTSPGRTVLADGRGCPAGVGSLHLPPSYPNGLASPGGLLPPTAKSPPPSAHAAQSPHQFAAKLPAHPATFVGTPPRAVGGTGPVLYPGSPGQLSPSTGSLVAPPALLSPQSFSLTVNPAQVLGGSPQCSARSPNLVRSANSFSSGSLPQRALSPSPKVLPGLPYQAVAPPGVPGTVSCCTRSVSPSSVPLSPPGVRAQAPGGQGLKFVPQVLPSPSPLPQPWAMRRS
ncbi:rngB, partial [Symbiodinium sp. CCMP2456]